MHVLRSPIEQFPFYMLIETSGSLSEHDEDKLTRFLANGMEAGYIRDGTVISEPSKMKVSLTNMFMRCSFISKTSIFAANLVTSRTNIQHNTERWILF